jgi:hypothetical protein
MALDSDNYKKMLAINFGMDYHIVWSDSVLKDSLKKIKEIIMERCYVST